MRKGKTQRSINRTMRAVNHNVKTAVKAGYSLMLARALAMRESARLGGFRLTPDTVKSHATKVNPRHKTYRLRVCGDRGNSNSERVLHTPSLEQQRKQFYTVNPQAVFNGERKEPYKVNKRESGLFNGFLDDTPTAKSAFLPTEEPLRGEPTRGSYIPYRKTP